MPKPTDYDKTHLRNMAAIGTRIDRIFKKAAEEAAKIGVSIKKTLPEDRIFSFDDYPATQKQIERLMTALQQSMETTIVSGVRSAWTLSNNKNNALVSRIFGDRVGDLSKEQYRRYFSTNGAALDAFLGRKEQGLNLSDRVWRYTNAFKHEIELGLDLRIRTGESAASMTRSLRQYLQHPDKLFRRVRDKHGNLRLSKAAQAFHPGRGVYRSSYKNARRLASTETNTAYRTSDHLRWQQMDFVVGIEIRLSNNHTLNGVPLTDICDTLKGRYPKDFKFVGWHPHCRCHVVTILKTEEEMQQDTQRILAGEQPEKGSVNAVRDVPAAFKGWVEEHAGRIKMGGNLPYFLRDNMEMVRPVLDLDNPIMVGDREWSLRELIAECRIEPTGNGRIYVHPGHGKNELQENLDFARWRAEQFGEEVVLLPNPQGVKSADSYNITRGVQEEYKRGRTASVNAIDRLLRDGAKQADHVILEIDCDITPGKVEHALQGRLKRCEISEVRLKIGEKEAIYSREQILKEGFKIRPEDFHNVSAFRNGGSTLEKGVEPNIVANADAKLAKFFGINKKTPQEIAIERHTRRDAEAIQKAWNGRRVANIKKAVADGLLPKEAIERLSALPQESLNARIEFLQKTVNRHASRTPQEIADIKDRWAQKQLRDMTIRTRAENILVEAKKWSEVDYSALEKFVAAGNLTKMRDESMSVIKAIRTMRDEEKALADLIPDAHGWHKSFSLIELKTVHSNVNRTFVKKGWKWDIHDETELENLRKGLVHEIDWMGTKGKARYSTWEVSQSAYKEKLVWAEKRIEMLGQKTAIADEINLLRTSRSAVGKQLVADFEKMFQEDTTDIATLRLKAADIKAKAKQLEKTRAKAKATSTPPSASIPFGGMTDEEAKKALIDFANKIGTKIDPSKIVVDNGFIHLQGDQQMYLYNALRAETPAEHKQLWNHAGGGGRHGGRGGYVQTGNSFEINRAFRQNSILGKLNAAVEDQLRLAGMTPDDMKTIRLLDKKIEEFSMPFPMLATRYVDVRALDNIFGVKFPSTIGNGLTDYSRIEWRRVIQTLHRKDIAVDPAFLSASTNEAQNVFYSQYGVKLKIEVPPGTPMYLTDNYTESEIVLGRGTRLEFIGISIEDLRNEWGTKFSHVTIRCRVKR